MKEDRKQELRRLLVESEKHVYIKHRGKVIPTSKYREYYLYKGYDPRIRSYRLTLPDIKDDSTKTKFLDFIRSELSEYIVDDRICYAAIIVKGGFLDFSLERFIRSLLRIAIVWEVERAIHVLERSIEKNCVSFQSVALLKGAKVDHELRVSDGIRLVPLPKSAADLPDGLPIDLPLTEQHFLGNTIVSMNYSISPAFCKPRDDPSSLPFQFQREIEDGEIGDFHPDDFCMALSLICNDFMDPVISWNRLSEDEIFSECSLPGSTYFSDLLDSTDDTLINETEANDAKLLWGQLTILSQQIREVLYIAINRCVSAKKNKSYVNAMIDLGIAFESLYLSRNNTSQLSYTFRVRAAWYLGKSVEDRKHLMMTFKTLYDCRSKAVHTGKLPDKVKEGEKVIPIHEFIDNAHDLCRQSIIKIIQEGKFPDWDSLVVGENAT